MAVKGRRLYAVGTFGQGGVGWVGKLGIRFLPPPLTVQFQDDRVVLEWPSDATDFRLQSTTDLGAGWTDADLPVDVHESQNRVLVSPSVGAQFYRLMP